MGVKDTIREFEKEKAKNLKEIARLQARNAYLDNLIGLLGKEVGGPAKAPAPKPAVKKAAPKPAKKGGKRGKRKGAFTVRDAIVKAVGGASEALPAGAIVSQAAALSGGAEASIRTQINALTKTGELKQVPYSGRGFKYEIGKAPAPKAKAVKKAKPKPAKK